MASSFNIIPAAKPRLHGGHRANQAIGELLQGFGQQQQQATENERIKELTGRDVSGLSPELKKLFVESDLKPKKQEADKSIDALQYSKGYQAIHDDDLDALNEVIIDPQTSTPIKQALLQLQEKKTRFNEQQGIEKRQRIQFIEKAYTSEIDRIQRLMKDTYMPSEKEKYKKQIENLNNLKKKDLKKLKKDPNAYADLEVWNLNENETPTQQNDSLPGIQKIKFDVSNPEHKAVRDEILLKVGGDREKAAELLKEKFL